MARRSGSVSSWTTAPSDDGAPPRSGQRGEPLKEGKHEEAVPRAKRGSLFHRGRRCSRRHVARFPHSVRCSPTLLVMLTLTRHAAQAPGTTQMPGLPRFCLHGRRVHYGRRYTPGVTRGHQGSPGVTTPPAVAIAKSGTPQMSAHSPVSAHLRCCCTPGAVAFHLSLHPRCQHTPATVHLRSVYARYRYTPGAGTPQGPP